MSTAFTKTGGEAFNNHDSNLVKWILGAGESGDNFVLPGYADRSVQVFGTFGGASVVFEGTNEDGVPTSYPTLSDPQGNGITMAAAGLKAVLEMTRVVRPRVVGGDGTTALTIILFAKR